ncbi:PTS sugar transporter subunit IIC [Lactococcus ileimucosae]|uniref:PTS sugar transporter subunit IIC n=1 Tax=Lactococcus ileimucosae TaxID=2941329 RepID=UPI0020441808|nr:PTS sugar transporter subunit IIC [Lactococcus ileimucosae]
MSTKKQTEKPILDFVNKVLNGTAIGIIVGLIPNAVLAALLKVLGKAPLLDTLGQVVLIFQMATPLLIGALIALQFGFNPMQMSVVAGAAFVGSGVIRFNPAVKAYVGSGTGDIVNTMLTAALAVIMVKLLSHRFGSVGIVLNPIIIGAGSGFLGLLLLPYVVRITTAIGAGINSFTTLQPILMSILISCSFALLIISPLSTVAIGMAIQLSGVSAGAAAMGVAATTLVLVVNSWRVNKSGVTVAIALGAMKMMMPNLFRHPIIMLPCLFTAIISAVPVALLSISGVPSSAGFGLVGLVGPLASLEAGLSLLLAFLTWFIVPIAAALLAQFIFEKLMKLYDRKEVFGFTQ